MADVRKGYVRLEGSERPRHARSKLLGPLDANKQVSLTFVVRQRPGSAPIPDFEYWQKTPLRKRKYLSPEEFTQKHGASQADLDAVAAFAASHGLTVLEKHPGRCTVVVRGTAGNIQNALGIELNQYESPRHVTNRPRPDRKSPATQAKPTTQIHRGFDGTVSLPAELKDVVTAVFGLDNRILGGTGGTGDPPGENSLASTTLAQLYNFPNSGASGQTIGIFNGGGNYDSTNDIPNYINGLAAGYTTQPTVKEIQVVVDGTTFKNNASAIPGDVSTLGQFNADEEITQDIETASTIAQGATIQVYCTTSTEDGWLAFLNRAMFPEAGETMPTVLSSSWFMASQDDKATVGQSFLDTVSAAFAKLGPLGISIFIASGDEGANAAVLDGSCHVQYPGSDPWITSVGGTMIGNVSLGPPASFTEWVWSDDSGNFGATGGGVSDYFPVPAYQSAAGVSPVSQNDSVARRGVPDVAGMVALAGLVINGGSFNFTGTSCVAPLYAGLTAVLNEALGKPIGFFNSALYPLGSTVCNDITVGNNDPNATPDSAFYTAGAGWDACTGWGSIDGTKLLNGLASQLFTQSFYFVIDKSTYGLDEVTNTPTYSSAFWLVLEGFTPNALAGGTPSPVAGAPTGIDIQIGPAQQTNPGQFTPQRILFPCSVSFAASAIKPAAQGGVFPNSGDGPTTIPISSSIVVLGQTIPAQAELELVAGADPYFSNVDPGQNNVFYLSQDLRIVTVTPGVNNAPIAGLGTPPQLTASDNLNFDTNAGYKYIQDLVGYLNSNYSDPTVAGFNDPFTSLFPNQSSALSDFSSVTPFFPVGFISLANYNFAVARVRMSGPANSSAGKNVRVFFRMFATETSDTSYHRDTSYPDVPDPASPAGWPGTPLLGSGDPVNGYITIPFFATGNYESNADFAANTDYSANSVNNYQIQIGASGEVWAYFGCYLNVYPTANTITGAAVQALLPSTHNCLVAQIAFEDAPIVDASQSPENCDKLAQRNLQITHSDNPGPPATHRVPQTFDLRPGLPAGPDPGNLLDYPDELMIEWRQTPVGSKASIYWPQVNAADVVSLATQFYSSHKLSATDAHTIACPVDDSVTYVPIPAGAGQNFAGLFTVDLPPSVAVGQEFTIVVRRLSTQGRQSVRKVGAAPLPGSHPWRYVVGSFAVRIPVSTANTMLPIEENTLAIMKWRLGQMSPASRWYSVVQRYISYCAARVDGLGGNSASVPPSPYGTAPGKQFSPKVCSGLAALTAALLAAFVVALGVLTTPTVVPVAVVLGVAFLAIGFWWRKGCSPGACSVIRVLFAGIAIGEAILAILLLLGFMAPFLIAVLGIGGAVALLLALAALLFGCP